MATNGETLVDEPEVVVGGVDEPPDGVGVVPVPVPAPAPVAAETVTASFMPPLQ